MDPFIEGQRWRDFHTTFVTVIRELLTPKVRPRYVVEVQEYVYLAREDEDPERLIEPDVAVIERDLPRAASLRSPSATISLVAPVIHTVPVLKRPRQVFLSIRNREWRDVVTVIEVLSPTNKRAGEERNEYLVKRWNVFRTPAHLVEIDLLRGGERLPTREPLEAADFYAFVCRKECLPQVEVYPWTLRQPLPVIPVPLAGDDPDVPLDLQATTTPSTTAARPTRPWSRRYPIGSDRSCRSNLGATILGVAAVGRIGIRPTAALRGSTTPWGIAATRRGGTPSPAAPSRVHLFNENDSSASALCNLDASIMGL
jgi:hypothetical protein